MLIIFCIFKTERTGFLIESIMCLRPSHLRVYSRVIIAMSVIFRLTQSTVREAWMTHCFLKISHKSCENKPNELGDYR